MRAQFEFSFYTIATPIADTPDPTLGLMGSLGWEMRGLTALPDGSIVVALQRMLGDTAPLPDAPTLAAQLEVPLSAPAVLDGHD